MARTKVMPKKDEKDGMKMLRTRAVVHTEEQAKGPSLPPISSTRNPSGSRTNYEMCSRGRVARGRGKVATVIANPTVGPDGCRGQAIYVRWGGASQEEDLTYHGRQSSPEGILKGWQN